MNSVNALSPKPWYRYPLVWMLISIPLSAIVVCSVIIWLAVSSDDGLVADDYYAQGMAINQSIDRDRRAAEYKLSAVLRLQFEARLVRLELEKGSLAEYPETLELSMRHATRADSDIAVSLLHGQANQYIGYLKQAPVAGSWHIELSDADWRLTARSRSEDMTEVVFKALAFHN